MSMRYNIHIYVEGRGIYMRGTGINEYLEWYKEEIEKYYTHTGYDKLKKCMSDKYDKRHEKAILSQYCFLLRYFEKSTRDTVMQYVTENYPEIVSFADLVEGDKPYYKFIWSFYKRDEKLVDNIFEKRGLEYKKFDIEYESEKLLIYVINSAINCDYNEDIFHSEDARKVQAQGYKPFNQFKRKMIPHGMCWYIYGNTETNFSESCRLFPVRILSVESVEDGWAKTGYREDLDCGFRSAWEANIARVLNSKQISWRYEEETYELQPPKYYEKEGKVLFYMPDFILEDGTIIEVKGFWDNRSKVRVSQFMEQYPNEKYVVIDTDIYRCISKKYKDTIPNWEEDTTESTSDNIQVVGITLPQRKPFVSALNEGDILQIVREPHNEYDSRAIKVNDSNGNQIGYFAKDCNSIYAPKMDMGFKYEIRVVAKQAKVLQCRIKLLNSDEMILPALFV